MVFHTYVGPRGTFCSVRPEKLVILVSKPVGEPMGANMTCCSCIISITRKIAALRADYFLSFAEGCSLRLQRWGPSGPTMGPFGPKQKYWKSFCKILQKSFWIFFAEIHLTFFADVNLENFEEISLERFEEIRLKRFRKSDWKILRKSIWNFLQKSVWEILRKSI